MKRTVTFENDISIGGFRWQLTGYEQYINVRSKVSDFNIGYQDVPTLIDALQKMVEARKNET